MFKLLISLLLVLTLTQCSVVSLNQKNFHDFVSKSPIPVFVKFFSPGCPHCRNIAGIYTEMASALQNIIQVAEVNCQDQSANPLCGEYQIQGVPAFKLFYGSKNKRVADFNGERTGKAMASFATKYLPEKFIHRMEESNQQLPEGSVVLVSDKIPPILKSLSLRFRRNKFYLCDLTVCGGSKGAFAVAGGERIEMKGLPKTKEFYKFVESVVSSEFDKDDL
ncbi:hypothetical protein P9112_003804 [Eukaryota sp. TZLM1-RC]